MEWILVPLADLLRGYVSAIDTAVTEDNFLDQTQLIGFPILFLGLIYSGIKVLWRRVSKYDEKIHEKARLADIKREQADKQLAEVRKRNDELLSFDPELFLSEMDRIKREGVLEKRQSYSESWLDPLRTALGVAFSEISRERLLQATDKEALVDARLNAWGANAALPRTKEYENLLVEVEEVAETLEIENLTEHEIAVLKLPRVKHQFGPLVAAGEAMAKRGKYKVAHLFFDRGLELSSMKDGPISKSTLYARSCCAGMRGLLGHYAEAEAEFREVWEIRRRPDVLGEEHPATLTTRANIAQQMGSLGRYAEAEAEFREVWEIYRRPDVLGEEHPNVLRLKFWLAKSLDAQERSEEASEILSNLSEKMKIHFIDKQTWVKELEEYLNQRSDGQVTTKAENTSIDSS